MELIDATIFRSKSGQALKPVPEVPLPTIPCDCMNFPAQSFYLAAHLWCLEKLFKRRNRHVRHLQTAFVEIKKDYVLLLWSIQKQDAYVRLLFSVLITVTCEIGFPLT